MKKGVIFSVAGLLVFVALAFLVQAQFSDTKMIEASQSSCCETTEATVVVADKPAGSCTASPSVSAMASCPGVQSAAKEAGCPAFTNTSDQTLKTENTAAESSCCEGSEVAALVADACCGNCS